MKKFGGTGGTWSVGKHPSEVLSSEKVKNTNFQVPLNPEYSPDNEIELYGGYLICESVGNKSDARAISAVPEMIEALQGVIASCDDIVNNGDSGVGLFDIRKIAEKALKKALG